LDSSLTAVLVNLGTGGIVVVLMIFGYLVPKPAFQRLIDENDKLKEALALERQRSNDATQAGTVTNQLIGALTTLATEHRDSEAREHSEARFARAAQAIENKAARDARAKTALDLGAEDVGL
jgi:hypothetical protein